MVEVGTVVVSVEEKVGVATERPAINSVSPSIVSVGVSIEIATRKPGVILSPVSIGFSTFLSCSESENDLGEGGNNTS